MPNSPDRPDTTIDQASFDAGLHHAAMLVQGIRNHHADMAYDARERCDAAADAEHRVLMDAAEIAVDAILRARKEPAK
jgi:hypothetical protein